MSRITTIGGLCIVLSTLTKQLSFIPQAALAAIIWVAISNLISFTDMWRAWKYSKKDFITIMVTATFTFVYNTKVGLAVGLGTSIIVYTVFDIVLSEAHKPRLFTKSATDKPGKHNDDVDVVRIESDINFLTAARVKDFISGLTMEVPSEPSGGNYQENLRFRIANAFDKVLRPNLLKGVTRLPKAIVIDMCLVKTVDISGLEALESSLHEVRAKSIPVCLINISPLLKPQLTHYGIHSDVSTDEVDFDEYARSYRMDLWDGDNELGNSNRHSPNQFRETDLRRVADEEVVIGSHGGVKKEYQSVEQVSQNSSKSRDIELV